ncbi:hypothetical protein Hanom_Chr07g00647991 [Helianthus anomalus]
MFCYGKPHFTRVGRSTFYQELLRGVQNSIRIRKLRNSTRFDYLESSPVNRKRIYNFKFDWIQNSDSYYTYFDAVSRAIKWLKNN